MKLKGRHILMGGDGVVWQRRWLWKWFNNFESYDNGLNKQRVKVNKKLAELQKEVDKLTELERQRRAIIKEIDSARDCERNTGPVHVKQFSFWDFFRTKIKDLPPAPKRYVDAVNFFKNKGARKIEAVDMAGIGAKVTHVDGESVSDEYRSDEGKPRAAKAILNTVSHKIVPESSNQQKKQRGGNNQQHQNNQQ